jgi:hypothetical protein
MTSHSVSVASGLVLLFCLSAANLHAQAVRPIGQIPCFAVHVRLNGKLVDDPQIITFRNKENETAVALKGGCFNVPAALLKEKTVDVFFAVSGNKVYLSSIPSGFLMGPWDVDLADNRFGREVVLPKHVRARDACAVTFHVGEPERMFAMALCRTPIPRENAKPD